MALSKSALVAPLRILKPLPPPLTPIVRLLSFATPEEAAADRRRRKRRLRIEPPLSSHRHQPSPRRFPSPKNPNPNPNSPKLPEPATSLTGNRLNLHNRILTLIRQNDLDEASLLVRHSIYSNCRPTVFTCNAVLAALLRQCRYSDLLSLHRFITQASVAPTIVTHNILLQAYCDCRKTDNAVEQYRLIVKEDCTVNPSVSTYRILVKGLVDNKRMDQAVELKNDMISKGFCAPDAVVYNHLMTGFVRSDEPDRVVELFEELKEKLGEDAVCDGIVCGNLMKGYFMKGMAKEAIDVFERVLGEGSKVRFGSVSYNLVLDALAKHGRLDEAIGLFERMMTEHDPPKKMMVNLGSFNVMVDGFCLAERFEEAINVFKVRMREKNCSPDVLSYNNLIDQLGKNGLVSEAEDLYKEMAERGFNPDEYTYVLLVESCFRAGRTDDAIDYFNKMVEAGLRPNANAYNKVIDGLAKLQRLDEAREFLDLMFQREVKPNVKSYEMLLQSFCEEASRLDDAKKVLKDLLMDEGVSLSAEMKEIVVEALRKESREEEFGRLLEDVEREKAEAAARAAEEKARAEALAKEEEEREKAEKAAKEAAAARASAAAIEAILGRNKSNDNKEEESSSSSASDVLVTAEQSSGDSDSVGKGLSKELILESSSSDVKNETGGAA